MSIQLMLQCAGGGRIDIPGEWNSGSSLLQVMESVQNMLPPFADNASLRYLQTSVARSQWSTTTLKKLGLQQGRALLILEESKNDPMKVDDPLQVSLQNLLQHNFDAVTKPCLITIIKILDNVLQNPNEPKVRCLRLSNATFDKKVGQVQGGVQVLLACGFERQIGPPPLLSTISPTEAVLVLPPQNESTSKIQASRKAIARVAVEELKLDPQDLPQSKPLPKVASASDHAVGSAQAFNPYRGHRFDGKSAATGINFGPEGGKYTSPTETQLQSLQAQERKLEASLQQPLADRGLIAGLPNSGATVTQTAMNTTTNAPTSDGSLLAKQFQRQQQERKQREEGGFTTKAMRDLEALKHRKVYSHVSLRVQFPDGSFLNAKFLPKETIHTVMQVVKDCFLDDANLQFDLYIAPPRRKLDPVKTLVQEELVPAAKVFCSWTGPSPQGSVGSFLKPTLFQETPAELYPTAKPIVNKNDSTAAEEDPNEEELMRRMMGGNKKTKKSKGKSGSKPKWFKG